MFYPLILLVQYLLSIGISFLISSMTVYLRDLEHLIQIAMMVLFYATPIVYSLQDIGARSELFSKILSLNPMAHIIEAYRSIFYYKQLPDFTMLGIILAISSVICVAGYMTFKKLEKRFAEEL